MEPAAWPAGLTDESVNSAIDRLLRREDDWEALTYKLVRRMLEAELLPSIDGSLRPHKNFIMAAVNTAMERIKAEWQEMSAPSSPAGSEQSAQSVQSRHLSDVTSEQIEEAVGARPTAGSISSRRSTGADYMESTKNLIAFYQNKRPGFAMMINVTGTNAKNQPETETYCFNEKRGTWLSGPEPFGALIRNAGMVAEGKTDLSKNNFYKFVKGITQYDEFIVNDVRYHSGIRFMTRTEFANQCDILDDCVFPCKDGLFNLITWEKETYAAAARRGATITTKDMVLESPTLSREELMASEEYKTVLKWWKAYLPEELLCEEVSMRLSTGVMRMGCDTFKSFLNLHGYGHNGKTAFCKMVDEAVGDAWRGTLKVEYLQPQPREDPSTSQSHMVAIQGKRYVYGSEPKTRHSQGHKMKKKLLDGDLSRQMTGGDHLPFRNMWDGGNSTPARPNTVFFVVCSNESCLVVPNEERSLESWAHFACPTTFLTPGDQAKVRAGQKLSTYVDKRYMATIEDKSPVDVMQAASPESRARYRLSVMLLMTEWYKYHRCRKHVDERVGKALKEDVFPGCIGFDDLRGKISDPAVAAALSEGDWLPDSGWAFVNQFKSSLDPRWAVPPKTPASILRLADWKTMRSEFATNSAATTEEEIQTPDEMFWRIFESTKHRTDVLPKGWQAPDNGRFGTKEHVGGMYWHFHNSDHNTPLKFELGKKEFAQLVSKYCVGPGEEPTEAKPLRLKKTKSILLIEFIKLRPPRLEEELDAMQEAEQEAPAERADRRAREAAELEEARAAAAEQERDQYEADTVAYNSRCEEMIAADGLCGGDGALLNRSQEELIKKLVRTLLVSNVLQKDTGSSSQVSLQRLIFLVYDAMGDDACVLPHSNFFKGWLQLQPHSSLRRTPTQEFKEWVARSIARAFATSLKHCIETVFNFTVENGVVKGVYERPPRVVRQRTTAEEASSSAGVTAQALRLLQPHLQPERPAYHVINEGESESED